MARGLAAAGYDVYSYDRLGYGKSSSFSPPKGGDSRSGGRERLKGAGKSSRR